MTQDGIAEDVRRDLRRAASEFYGEYAPDKKRVAVEGVERAFCEFMTDVRSWVSRMPEAKGKLAGRGFTQTEPSQRTSQVLKELRAIRAFLHDNLDVPLGAETNRDKLDGRREIGRDTIQLLAGLRFDGDGFLVDQLEIVDNRSRRVAPLMPWLSSDAVVDVHRSDRASRRSAGNEQPTLHMLLVPRRGFFEWFESLWKKFPETREAAVLARYADGLPDDLRAELIRRAAAREGSQEREAVRRSVVELLVNFSNSGTMDVSIGELMAWMMLDERRALMDLAAESENRLRIMLDLLDDFRGEGRQQPLVSFQEPCPLFRLVGRLVELGWSREDDDSLIGPRILDEHDAREFEERMGKLLSGVVSQAETLAKRRPKDWQEIAFKPLVGFEENQVSKDLSKEAPTYRVQLMTRIARAYIRKREQAIVISEHAERLRLWLDEIGAEGAAGGQATNTAPRPGDPPFEARALCVLMALGYYHLLDWAKESEAHLRYGTLFAPDYARKETGEPVRVRELSLKLLVKKYRRPRCEARFGGVYFADVEPVEVRSILELCHKDKPELQSRVREAFDIVEPLFKARRPNSAV